MPRLCSTARDGRARPAHRGRRDHADRPRAERARATRSSCAPRAAPSRTPGGPASCPRSPSTPRSGATLLRVRDRLSGRFDDAPADSELSLAQVAAWDTYSVGRLARLGYPVHQPRWIYNFRNRHGFTDRADECVRPHLVGRRPVVGGALGAVRRVPRPRLRLSDPPCTARDRAAGRAAVNGVELDRAGGRRPRQRRRSSSPTASPRRRGPGATSFRCSPTPATTSSPPTSAATADRPDPIASRTYGIESLCGDLLGLLDETGHEQAVFVGHDWGALDRVGPRPPAPRAGPGGGRRQRAVHLLARPAHRVPRGCSWATASSTSSTSSRSARPSASSRPTRERRWPRCCGVGRARASTLRPRFAPAEGTGFLTRRRRAAAVAMALADRGRPRPVRRRVRAVRLLRSDQLLPQPRRQLRPARRPSGVAPHHAELPHLGRQGPRSS